MKAALLGTGSIPAQHVNRFPSSSPRLSLTPSDGKCKNGIASSPRVSISSQPSTGIRRSVSDTDMLRSETSKDTGSLVSRVGSLSFPDMGMIVEEDTVSDWPGHRNDESGGKSKIGEYYQQMLKANPGDSLLLRNYGKYLHEVEKNTEKAEEYYGRAILSSPGDGELLSLYGNLIWETQRHEDRAQSYFNQAVHASPHDCMVLGSYAHFLWEADEDEEDRNEVKQGSVIAPSMVGAC